MNALLNLHFDVRGDLLNAARECEEDVFLQAFGNTREQLADEYGPYNDQSVFVAVADDDGLVYGACRLITPGAAGLKTLNDVSREPWGIDGLRSAGAAGIDPSNAWDVATLGVRKDFRGSRMSVAIALYHAIVQGTRANEIGSITAILDDQIRRILTMSDFIMPTLPGARTGEYLGSPSSTPVYGHCAGMVDGQRRMNPDAYRLMSLGIGLDGIAVPEASAFELRPRLVPVGAEVQYQELVSSAAA
jgi:hypothetical protein